MPHSGTIRSALGLLKHQLIQRISQVKEFLDQPVPKAGDHEEVVEDYIESLHGRRTLLESAFTRVQAKHDDWVKLIDSWTDLTEIQKEHDDHYDAFCTEFYTFQGDNDELLIELEKRDRRARSLLHFPRNGTPIKLPPSSIHDGSIMADPDRNADTAAFSPVEGIADQSTPPGQQPEQPTGTSNVVSSGPLAETTVLTVQHQPTVTAEGALAASSDSRIQHGSVAVGSGTVGRFAKIQRPKITLPTFDGDYFKFKQFWSIFETNVHNCPELNGTEKFTYLIPLLEGTAKEAIDGLLITNDNYEVAIDILRKRFDRADERMICNLYSQFRRIPSSGSQTREQRKTLDQCERCLRQLVAAGEDVNATRALTFELLSKFPPGTIRYIQDHHQVGPNSKLCDARAAMDKTLSQFECNAGWIDDLGKGKLQREQPEPQKRSSLPQSKAVKQSVSSKEEFRNSSLAAVDQKNGKKWQRRTPLLEPPGACYLCGGEHFNSQCTKYTTADDRKRRLEQQGICSRCLKSHDAKQRCNPRVFCVYCRSASHKSCLCPQEFPAKSNPPAAKKTTAASSAGTGTAKAKGKTFIAVKQTADSEDSLDGSDVAAATNDSKASALFQTAKAMIVNPANGKRCMARIALDTLSSRSYVTESLGKRLNLKPSGSEVINLSVFGSSNSVRVPTRQVEIDITLKDGKQLRVEANTTKVICRSRVLPVTWSDNETALLSSFKDSLADDPFDSNGTMDILLGSASVWQVISGAPIPTPLPKLNFLPTKLGLMLTGETEEANSDDETLLCLTESTCSYPSEIGLISCESEAKTEYPDVNEFWDLERIGISDCPIENDDDVAMQMFQESVVYENGRYSVSFPWIRDKADNLQSNYKMAYNRFHSLSKRLKTDAQLLKGYRDVIQTQKDRGIIERVPADDLNTPNLTHFMPHHPVVKLTSNTTKIRIVYDGSSRSAPNDLCLNECMYRGPVLLPDLCHMLFRMRMGKFVVVSDIEKAFLQVGLKSSERDATRFLWFSDDTNPDLNDNLAVYRFCRVPFGVISSPFLLSATIQHHLSIEGTSFSAKLKDQIYVDNVVSALDEPDDLMRYYHDLKLLFERAGMNITEFCSNSDELMDNIPKDDIAPARVVKVLGLEWDSSAADSLRIRKPSKWDGKSKPTKRGILQTIASVFDPLGFFQPVLLPAKCLLQHLWECKSGWDARMRDDFLQQWEANRNEIEQIFEHRIPRIVGSFSRPHSLAVFTDASSKAYAVAVYLRSLDENGSCQCNLIFSKSRLAPTSKKENRAGKISLPRLELLGAYIGARAAEFCRRGLQNPDMKVDFFIDSECVLHWLRSRSPLRVFVSRRIEEIRKLRNCTFHYVNTHDNPADFGTRGKRARELFTNSMWWHGPAWLSDDAGRWPKHNVDSVDDEKLRLIQAEYRQQPALDTTVSIPVVQQEHDDCPGLLGLSVLKYSSLDRLIRHSVILTKFLKFRLWSRLSSRVRDKHPRLNGLFDAISPQPLTTAGDYAHLRTQWCLWVQECQFPDAVGAIDAGRKSPLVYSLQVFMDSKGLLRTAHRFQHADLPEASRNPILLPKDHPFTNLVIRYVHESSLHTGVAHTLSLLRRSYWVTAGRSQVRKQLQKCADCRRMKTGTAFRLPDMPAWPAERVSRSRPFEFIGLDYFGPITVKVNDNTQKMWCCLFTCMATRAVHLEPVMDCSAREFHHCLIRFVSRRGVPTQIISDNAAQFRLVQILGEKAWQSVSGRPADDGVLSYSAQKGIQWSFITELAPWQGGFYERLVRVVKDAMRVAIGRRLLTWTDFVTLLAETEAIVNTRPITYVPDDIESNARVLRPSDFLLFDSATVNSIPDSTDVRSADFGEAGKQLVSVWRQRTRALQKLWKRWYEEYLLSLRESRRRAHRGGRGAVDTTPRLNQVVLIKDTDAPRGSWKLAKITRISVGCDGKARSADVRLANGIALRRSISHLIPLEIDPDGATSSAPLISRTTSSAQPLSGNTSPGDGSNAPPSASNASFDLSTPSDSVSDSSNDSFPGFPQAHVLRTIEALRYFDQTDSTSNAPAIARTDRAT